MKDIHISILNEDFTKKDVEEINALFGELTQNGRIVGKKDILAVMQNGVIFVAREEADSQKGKIIGMASLLLVHKLTRIFSRVEDVVLTEKYRGLGIGKRLMEVVLAHEWPKDTDVRFIELMSKPSRDVANRLYQKLGFEEYTVNVYRKKIK